MTLWTTKFHNCGNQFGNCPQSNIIYATLCRSPNLFGESNCPPFIPSLLHCFATTSRFNFLTCADWFIKYAADAETMIDQSHRIQSHRPVPVLVRHIVIRTLGVALVRQTTATSNAVPHDLGPVTLMWSRLRLLLQPPLFRQVLIYHHLLLT